MILIFPSKAQELFPYAEPASTMPKKVFGIRQINETFRDINARPRYYYGLRVMYGLTKRITLMSMAGGSNHHLKRIPDNFVYYILNHHQRNFPKYPDLFEGIHGYIKIRVFSSDEEQKHFRIAVYGEANKSFVAHTEAEPNLMTENTGFGGGLIFTKLHKRFAASFTWGFVKPLPYEQTGGIADIKFLSGNLTQYNCSFGYRLYPRQYDGYKDININVYLEIFNRTYTAATIKYDGVLYDYEFLKSGAPYTYNGFSANQYSEVRPSVQFIFNSSSRLDMGFAFPAYSRSYLHDYPLIFINIQKYLFR